MLRPSTAPRLIQSLSKDGRGALRVRKLSMRALIFGLVLSLSKDEAVKLTHYPTLSLVVSPPPGV